MLQIRAADVWVITPKVGILDDIVGRKNWKKNNSVKKSNTVKEENVYLNNEENSTNNEPIPKSQW